MTITEVEIIAAAKAMRRFASSPMEWEELEPWQRWHWLERAYAALRATKEAKQELKTQ